MRGWGEEIKGWGEWGERGRGVMKGLGGREVIKGLKEKRGRDEELGEGG